MSFLSFTDSFFKEQNDKTQTPTNIVGDVNFDLEESDIFQNDILSANCSRIFDVRQFLPYWLVQDHENNKTLLIKFLQHYYDWLYCPDLSDLHTNNIRELQDIENITDQTKESFIKSIIPQLYDEVKNNTTSEIKDFLLNLKRDILIKRGTKEGIVLFFTKLFPEISKVTINSDSFLQLQITINTTNIEKLDTYVSAYNNYMHIAGTSATIGVNLNAGSESTERQEDDEILETLRSTPSGATAAQLFDFSVIGNYIVYNMGDTASLAPVTGCSAGISGPPPRGITGNTADVPTFAHPEWLFGVTGQTLPFGNINIFEFIALPLDGNPNTNAVPCSSL
tara:strand:- start:34 stop:1044 length:1011 start_codon:yes stop_codon:yes gene_type:complete